jgi:ATP-dependent Clp protease ATP-binding subunit ClpC
MYSLFHALDQHRPAIFLAKIISRSWQHRIRTLCAVITLVGGLGSIALLSIPTSYELFFPYIFGVTLIAMALWIEQLLVYCFHNQYYFFGLNGVIGLDAVKTTGCTYEVAESIIGYEKDIALGFVNSKIGSTILLRSGLTPEQINNYVQSDRTSITARELIIEEKTICSLSTIGQYLLRFDPAWKRMLSEAGIQEKEFLGALYWVVQAHHQQKRSERWWSKDQLSQTQGIGRTWTYGHTYHLEQYTKSLYAAAIFSGLTPNTLFTNTYTDKLEEVLARSQSANALIIGRPGVGKMDVVIALQRRIRLGQAKAAILDQSFVVLDTDALFATCSDKSTFEETFLLLLNEAVGAGNINLVINNTGTFIREAEALNVFIPELIDPYLALTNFHIIALDTPDNFHHILAKHSGFTRRFVELLIEEPGQESTIHLLTSIAVQNEQQGMFTYPTLEAIAIGADRYLVNGIMPDKAIALLSDLAMRPAEGGTYTPEQVYSLIASKTGMPVGPVSSAERDALLNLESTLHSRVIGQDAALSAIAKAMRRSRAGIVSGERPIGSFLFLGPTGVGKTETAKALAFIFFGNETSMIRLDMSEYAAADRVGHLIGNEAEPGILPSLLQEHPYTVLLLDEFEKADRSVHDIFLQILDEGMFTSGSGSRVNARNTIIIATSNAGSQRIIEAVQSGIVLADITRELIDHIISEGIYRPELINRFDSTILFEPLSKNQQREVAKLMLTGLAERIEEQGYHVTVTPALLELLVERGYDPIFGARPMQRAIQDIVEEALAQKIISGVVQKGDTIHLDVSDVSL